MLKTRISLQQKENNIRDYLEDIEEKPRPRMFWPRQIWSKYDNKLEVNNFIFFQIKYVRIMFQAIFVVETHLGYIYIYFN